MSRLRRRPLTIPEIIAWVGLHHSATGIWPNKNSGAVLGARFETWGQIDSALRFGLRSLPGGGSLPKLLAEHCGVRNSRDLQPLTEELILEWADDHYATTGQWPNQKSSVIPNSNRETWAGIDTALRVGSRELAGGSSLARLLAERRGVRNRKELPRITEQQIIAWAEACFARVGKWPTAKSGAVADAPGETWLAVDMALRHGRRGLPGGTSLARLLAERLEVRNAWTRPNFTILTILNWLDEEYRCKDEWPNEESGPVAAAPDETWCAVNHALKRGLRGLPGGSSLAQLLASERGVRIRTTVPKLTRKLILRWADAHRRKTGHWPTRASGPITEAPGETWAAIDAALMQKSRGLRGGSSLARLLAEHRDRRHYHERPLTQKQILAWADAHFERTGAWPTVNSGPVVDAPAENWDALDQALRMGNRGLPGGSSLARLLARKRGVRNRSCLPPLGEEEITRWALLHQGRTGVLPTCSSGQIIEAPGESWDGVDHALRHGRRSLPGGSSLAKMLVRTAGTQSRQTSVGSQGV